MGKPSPELLALAANIARQYAAFDQVEAVTLAGSQSSGMAEPTSDLDIYVYLQTPLSLNARHEIANTHAVRAEVNNQFWEPGDEWIDQELLLSVDVMFRQVDWIDDQIDRVLVHFQASVGYTTAMWYNVLSSFVLFDRRGWFQQFQSRANQPYPEALQRAIFVKNYPLLRQNISSYKHQIESAIRRQDLVSINHRVAALLASYFDILFAANRLPHPGEKRQVQFALDRCIHIPDGMQRQIEMLLQSCSSINGDIIPHLDTLLDKLDQTLVETGLKPVETAA